MIDMSWLEFWNKNHSIYVNDRHKALHYEGLASDYLRLIQPADAKILDYGCGEALTAPSVARACGHLYLFDAASNVEAALRQRFDGDDDITVLSESALKALPAASLDMIICNSVLQYLSLDECRRFVAFAATKLKPGGRLIVADVIPPDVSAVRDTIALMDFARRGGFVFAAVRGLVATYFSEYRNLRAIFKLTTFTDRDMRGLMSSNGFEVERSEHNVGHNQARMTFIATRV
jgi:SAM-dependent methyltransferase